MHTGKHSTIQNPRSTVVLHPHADSLMPVSYNDLECGHFNDKDGEVCSSIRHYLIQHFLEDHTLEKLSRYFGINPNKLMYLFRKAFNKSVFEYLAELRMEFAKRLLQKGNMRVVDVARAIGYKNPNHFSTAFKRRFGVSPTAIK
ncbi:MAG: helix-turn-helix transcriptional regulator [Cyclobacteriaceae bacterium]|nr:helix-turn-helix transcriptional regulator [Cyclobacteriaceae bacterium]